MITAGNVDDRKPVPKLSEKVFGKLFDDKGYISSELFESLRAYYQAKIKHEKQINAIDGQALA